MTSAEILEAELNQEIIEEQDPLEMIAFPKKLLNT
jgi:hypothetical protein